MKLLKEHWLSTVYPVIAVESKTDTFASLRPWGLNKVALAEAQKAQGS